MNGKVCEYGCMDVCSAFTQNYLTDFILPYSKLANVSEENRLSPNSVYIAASRHNSCINRDVMEHGL